MWILVFFDLPTETKKGNHPKSPVLLNKKLASSSLASFFIIEGKHLLHLLLTSVVSQIV